MRAVALAEEGTEQTGELVEALYNLWDLYKQEKQYEEALTCLKRILELEENSGNNKEADICDYLFKFSFTYQELNREKEALFILLSFQNSIEKQYGKDSVEMANILEEIARLLEEYRKHEKAEPYLRRTVTIRENLCPLPEPNTIRYLQLLGDTHAARGNTKEADSFYRQAMELSLEAASCADISNILEKISLLYKINPFVLEQQLYK